MAGARQSAAMLEMNGTAHMSAAELNERRDREVHVAIPDRAEPPKWLAKKHHAEYRRIGEILLAAGLFTELDRDVLGQYFVAFEQWLLASRKLNAAMRRNGEAEAKAAKEQGEDATAAKAEAIAAAREDARTWSGIQKASFSQARQCADSLGLSVTSRCRIVVPTEVASAAAAAGHSEDEDEFSKILAQRQREALAGGSR